jgi:PTH1 family peptidyl-tRNA hydrolase
MSPSQQWLVVGLGNPGAEYAANRHNIGFMVVDELAKAISAPSFRKKHGGEITEASMGPVKLVLLKPQQYMNLSGQAVQQVSAFFKIAPQQTIVVHDEIDLPYEMLRLKVGGGHGGHNGLRSIHEHVGAEYLRLRCGVGKPGAPGDRDRVVNHVLGDFSKAEQKTLDVFIQEAVAAIRLTLEKGATFAMNKVNQSLAPRASGG